MVITIQEHTSNAQSIPRRSPDIYFHAELCSGRLCSVQHGPLSECDGHLQIIKFVEIVRIQRDRYTEIL